MRVYKSTFFTPKELGEIIYARMKSFITKQAEHSHDPAALLAEELKNITHYWQIDEKEYESNLAPLAMNIGGLTFRVDWYGNELPLSLILTYYQEAKSYIKSGRPVGAVKINELTYTLEGNLSWYGIMHSIAQQEKKAIPLHSYLDLQEDHLGQAPYILTSLFYGIFRYEQYLKEKVIELTEGPDATSKLYPLPWTNTLEELASFIWASISPDWKTSKKKPLQIQWIKYAGHFQKDGQIVTPRQLTDAWKKIDSTEDARHRLSSVRERYLPSSRM